MSTPKYLSKRKWEIDVKSTLAKYKSPFDLKAVDFLDFAKKDVKTNDLRGDTNAITNIKRCIENRLDTILHIFGYHEKASREKWSFPKKLGYVDRMGIRAPGILHMRINLERVFVEHGYRKPPKHSEILDILEIAELFLIGTDFVVKAPVYSCSCHESKNLLEIELKIDQGELNVKLSKNLKRG